MNVNALNRVNKETNWTEFELYESLGGTSDFRLQTSEFRLPTSDFRLPTSDFRLPTSDFRLPTSDFRLPSSEFRLLSSDFRFLTSDFRLPISEFRVPSSEFRLLSSDFRFLTSDFRLLTSDFRLLTSDFWYPTSDFRLRSDEGLTLETSAFESLYGGQFTLSIQLIKPSYFVTLPPTQHHSFFRNLPLFIQKLNDWSPTCELFPSKSGQIYSVTNSTGATQRFSWRLSVNI